SMLSRLGLSPFPHRPTHHNRRRNQHQVLDDVLPLQRRHPGHPFKASIRQQHQRQERSRHLQKQQQDRGTSQRPHDQPHADGHLPHAQQRIEPSRIPPVHRVSHQ